MLIKRLKMKKTPEACYPSSLEPRDRNKGKEVPQTAYQTIY